MGFACLHQEDLPLVGLHVALEVGLLGEPFPTLLALLRVVSLVLLPAPLRLFGVLLLDVLISCT